MIHYIRMKKNEWKIKAAFYGAAAAMIDNQKEILELLQKLYAALKDVPEEELMAQLASQLAALAHKG